MVPQKVRNRTLARGLFGTRPRQAFRSLMHTKLAPVRGRAGMVSRLLIMRAVSEGSSVGGALATRRFPAGNPTQYTRNRRELRRQLPVSSR